MSAATVHEIPPGVYQRLQGPPERDWQAHLRLNSKGQPYADEENVCIALREAPELRGRLRFNELDVNVECRDMPWDQRAHAQGSSAWRSWTNADDGYLATHLQRCDLRVRVSTCATAATLVARKVPVHPVRDYLDRLKWDGEKRLDSWLSRYLGAVPEDEEQGAYLREVGRRFMIAAVARTYDPGCKVDTMLVLEGPQGAGKSRALAALMPDPAWFTDGLAIMGSKDSCHDLCGKWLIEVAELSAMGRARTECIKAFLSRSTDHYRPSHERRSEDFPRRCVFVGTTNSDTYLADETGGRRFWPVRVGTIDVTGITTDRDQLWAEAVAAFNAKERWWLEQGVEAIARGEQEERRQEDVWEPRIMDWLADRGRTTVAEIMTQALGLSVNQMEQPEQNRVARILKAHGWARKQRRINGKPLWVYLRPGVTPAGDT